MSGPAPIEEKIRALHAVQTEERTLRGVHKIGALLLRGGYSPGRYRKGPNRAGSYVAPRASDVPELMHTFAARLESMLVEARSDEEARLVAA